MEPELKSVRLLSLMYCEAGFFPARIPSQGSRNNRTGSALVIGISGLQSGVVAVRSSLPSGSWAGHKKPVVRSHRLLITILFVIGSLHVQWLRSGRALQLCERGHGREQ